jgi:hypothetical protein
MAILIITTEESTEQIISGVPQVVSLSTNLPSIIYYTLDGSVPDTFSTIFISPIEMPTDVNSVNLRAYAVSGDDTGYLNVYYRPEVNLFYTRRDSDYGYVVDAYGVANEGYDGYGLNTINIANVPESYYDEPIDMNQLEYSVAGSEGIGPGTLITLLPMTPEIRNKYKIIDQNADSPNNNNVYFDPKSAYIVIDGRDGYEDQAVRIINRHLFRLSGNSKYKRVKFLTQSQTFLSGTFLRSYYSIRNGKGVMVSYYYDSFLNKWIKSIQNYQAENVPNIGPTKSGGPNIIFKWIRNKPTTI